MQETEGSKGSVLGLSGERDGLQVCAGVCRGVHVQSKLLGQEAWSTPRRLLWEEHQ